MIVSLCLFRYGETAGFVASVCKDLGYSSTLIQATNLQNDLNIVIPGLII